MTTATTMNKLLTANEKAKHVDAWRRYRTRLRDAAAVEQLDVKQAGTLADAANAAGVDESDIARHISAVRTHQQHTARIKQLQTEVPAADCKRETLLAELHTLNDKLNELKAAIGNTTRPARERSHLEETIRRLETKHDVVFGTEVA